MSQQLLLVHLVSDPASAEARQLHASLMPYGPETGSACLSLEFGSASSQVGAEKKRCTDASTAGPTYLGKQRMNVPNFVLPGSSAPVGRSLVKIELIVGLEGGN